MRKQEIVDKIMLSDDEYWVDLWKEYVEKGLMAEKKEKLLEILQEMYEAGKKDD